MTALEKKITALIEGDLARAGAIHEGRSAETAKAILAAIEEEERGAPLKEDVPPLGYSELPKGVRCRRCLNMYQIGNRFFCCNGISVSQKPITPPDTVTVPREPSEAMVEAGMIGPALAKSNVRAIYRAMIEAHEKEVG